MKQVMFNRESTERQYALVEKAESLGWAQEQIQVIDEDLGISGSGRSQRQGFQNLVAKVSLGEVGAIFGLEVSRLARSSAQLLRLLELCGLFNTIVADDDGIYDLTDFNDRLILGFKGTMSECELHYLRLRMLGGKKNKAEKGELRFPLPVGYVYAADNQVIIDPDEGVQAAVHNIFAAFKAGGSAYSVVRYFTKNGLQFPKRAYGGAWAGKLVWGKLTHSRVLGIIYNPSYAGMYVYGRYQDRKTITPDGIFIHHITRLPQELWPICIPDHHPAYITKETYEANMKQLRANLTNAEVSGAAREGAALLQGIIVCGKCGKPMSVRYTSNGGIVPKYECKARWEHGNNKSVCTSVPAKPVDNAIAQRVINAVQPANLELATQVMNRLLEQNDTADKSWKLTLERAEYDVARTERQYQQVEPENRLVARSLETQWNERLAALDKLRKEYDGYKSTRNWVPTEKDKNEILALANELPQIWNDSNTTAKDRKRILRTVIEDVTVFAEPRQADIRIGLRWRSHCYEEIKASKPIPSGTARKHTPQTVEQVRTLSNVMNDVQIAEHFNTSGYKTPEGKEFTASSIRWILYSHNITPFAPKRDGLSVKEIAEKFDVGTSTVYYWIDHGIVNARKTGPNHSWDIALDDQKYDELSAWVRNSGHLAKK
jgi:DNA invertase Pin-like site-specific DNA recombinase